MPIAFDSKSHGKVVFGFYNIETDSLLLNELFFFSTDFCDAVRKICNPMTNTTVPGHSFLNQEDIGDFTGAMHGVHYTGYMGELYQEWPFPSKPEDFRQKLDGTKNRAKVQAILTKHAPKMDIELGRSENHDVQIGQYTFNKEQFIALLHYVRRGGMPTWQGFEEGKRPPYVTEMLAECLSG